MTPPEIKTFVAENQHGVLAFAGDEPYALPMGYTFRKDTFIIGLTSPGVKWKYVEKDPRVCFTICRPRWHTEGKKIPCSTLVVKGRLEPLLDREAYGLTPKMNEAMKALGIRSFIIAEAIISSRRCTRKPCELFFNNPTAQPED